MLQALMNYGEGLDSEPGFKTREVRWCVELGADGRFLNVLPLGDGKRGAVRPRCPDMPNMNAGGKSHFLVETVQTVVLLFKASEDQDKIERTHGKHRFFVDILRLASGASSHLTVIANALAQNDIATMPAIALRKELLWGMKVILEGAVVPAIAADLTKIGKAPAWGDVGKYVPSGWLKHNAAVLYEAETKHYLDPAASDGGVFGGYPPELTPRNLLHGISIGMAAQICPCVSNIIESARQTQFLKDKLRQRCLLAAHQMSTGQPATVLTALVPHFLMQIKPPHSPILIPNPTPP